MINDRRNANVSLLDVWKLERSSKVTNQHITYIQSIENRQRMLISINIVFDICMSLTWPRFD